MNMYPKSRLLTRHIWKFCHVSPRPFQHFVHVGLCTRLKHVYLKLTKCVKKLLEATTL